MKMSESNFKRFTEFYNFVVEKASDEEVDFIMSAVVRASELKTHTLNINNFNAENPDIDPRNAELIREFFINFLKTANNDDAIYLLEGLKAICKEAKEHSKKVEKFVARKKKENGEK